MKLKQLLNELIQTKKGNIISAENLPTKFYTFSYNAIIYSFILQIFSSFNCLILFFQFFQILNKLPFQKLSTINQSQYQCGSESFYLVSLRVFDDFTEYDVVSTQKNVQSNQTIYVRFMQAAESKSGVNFSKLNRIQCQNRKISNFGHFLANFFDFEQK